MVLLRCLALYDHGGRVSALAARRGTRRRERGKPAAQPREVILRKAAAHGNDDPLGAVLAFLERAQRSARHAVERSGTAQHRLPERAGEDPAHELLHDDILRRVAVHVDLLKHDAALIDDVRFREERIEEHFAENIGRLVQMAVQHAGVEAGGIAGGEGVDLPADGVHAPGKLRSGAVGRALEEHVLNEVGAALLAALFIARADADPDADGSGADAGHFLVGDAHAVR